MVTGSLTLAAPPLVIGGVTRPGHGAPFDVTDPATEEVVCSVASATTADVDAAVRAARVAFDDGRWSDLSGDERADVLARASQALARHRDDLVRSLVTEVGCPIATVRTGHVELAIESLSWFAEAARRDRTRYLEPHLDGSPSTSVLRRVPVGVITAICGYNSPLVLGVTKLAPALAAGCTTVLMPSPLAPVTLLRVVELLHESGLPDGVVNSVVGDAEIGRALTEHPGVDKITFTGSVGVGRQVMGQAARTLKDVVLELGGKSAAVILPGTDLDAYVPSLHRRWARNAGQGCQSPTRVLVQRRTLDDLVDATRDALATIVVGDPWDDRTETGPVISAAHRDRIAGYVSGALDDGGTIVAQSPLPDVSRGWWSAPTVITGVDPSSRICQEEIFGPVCVILPYDDVEEAVAIANATDFGLGAYVYGPDLDECQAVAVRMRAGSVYINGGGSRRPDAPFGGFKSSGIGREQGEEGILEFFETQHVQWPLPM